MRRQWPWTRPDDDPESPTGDAGSVTPPAAATADTPVTGAALAGLVAAGVALGAGELTGAATGEPPSLVTGVGDEFVDRFAASLKDLAVRLFGTNDKLALLVGIVVVSLLAGAGLGVAARRRFAAGVAGFGVFGALGIWAGLKDPLGSAATVWLSALVATGAGIAALWWLLQVAAVGPAAAAARVGVKPALDLRPARAAGASADDGGAGGDVALKKAAAEDPRSPHAPRRAFLGWAGGLGAGAALAATGASRLRGRSTIEAERAEVVLPPAGEVTPVPAGSSFDVDGLSPYVVPNDDFYRIDTALSVPQVSADSWHLRIDGRVDTPLEFTLDELLARDDLVETPVTLVCVSNEVGGDLIGNAQWLGVPLTTLLDEAGVQDGGTQIMGESVDGFTAGFPTELAYDGRTALVAVGMNGEPLPADHGYPCRLVIAGLYGYVSATKWLSEIRLVGWDEEDGYWMPRGWSKEGPIKLQSRIDVPRSDATVTAGLTPIAGVAWSPSIGISGVEVRVDGGDWEQATLGDAVSDDTWVQWMVEWDAPPGDHELEVRAIDTEGQVQTSDEAPPAPDGASGWHLRRVSVSGET